MTLRRTLDVNALCGNPTKWSNKLKQFVGKKVDHFVGRALKGLRELRMFF